MTTTATMVRKRAIVFSFLLFASMLSVPLSGETFSQATDSPNTAAVVDISTEVVAASDSGDTAWILASTALVLFMTLPGLALFYGGLVRSKNILSVLMHCLILTGVVSILWVSVWI